MCVLATTTDDEDVTTDESSVVSDDADDESNDGFVTLIPGSMVGMGLPSGACGKWVRGSLLVV